MLLLDGLTDKSIEAIQDATEVMRRYGHNLIDTEHLLLAILEKPEKILSQALEKLGNQREYVVTRLTTTLSTSPKVDIFGGGKDQIFVTPRVKRIIDIAKANVNNTKVFPHHLFLAILTEHNTPAARILDAAGITRDKIYNVMIEYQDNMKTPKTSSIKTKSQKKNSPSKNNKVFVVHGHDNAMKEAVARAVEKMGLNAIVLHEKPNQGKTIIEKFTNYSEVGFAIVLLSPDDVASSVSGGKEYYRARQNVIFELGFFIGKIGRDRVISLYRQADNFEFPSDYSGVLFIPFDENGRWKFDVIRELKASGYDLDANKLLE